MRFIQHRTSLLATLAATTAMLAVPAFANAAEPLVLKTIEVPAVTTTGEVTVSPVLAAESTAACQNIRFATEDGNWQGKGFTLLCKSQKVTLSPGNGIKGIFAQVQGAQEMPDGTYKTVESNVVYVKLRKVAAEPVPAPAGLKITAVNVDMPDPAKVNDPMVMPSERLPHVNFVTTGAEKCSLDSFQYRLTAEGAWKDVVNRTRPFVHLDPTPGVQNLYVQLVGACEINGETTYGPQGNIFHTTVTVPDYNAQPNPQPNPEPDMRGPIVLDSVTVPATTTTRDIEFVQNYHGGEGCLSIRTATEDGNWNGWVDCKTKNRTAASAGLGAKGLFVQLKGSNGSLSLIKYVKYQVVKDAAGGNPTPQPGPDKTAPVLSKVTVTTASPSRFATVHLTATDSVAVTQARFANEDGTWGEWQTFKTAMPQLMSAGKGYKGVFVQVRDAAGNASTITYTKFTVA